MHSEHLDRRRRAVAERWDLSDEVVLVGAGERIHIPGRADRTYPFRAHSEYFYLTDRERPGGVLAFDPHEGWVDFVVPVTRDELLWEGGGPGDPATQPTSSAGTSGVSPVAGLTEWLAQRGGRAIACLGVPVPGVDAAPDEELRAALNAVRRPKDEVELERMRVAERATSAGFAAAAAFIEPGRSERDVRIELEAAFLRNGADMVAYDTIVGGGPNAAVLHFPPSDRRLQDGELVLIDAGGEFRGYASDITRTYPVSGTFTPEQAELHALVRVACVTATGRCRAGVEWRDIHRTAARVIAEGLVEFGLLRGDPDDLVEGQAVSLFFPHGVGHLVGLGVRDAGEVLPGREPRPDEFPQLRIDLPLEPGFVVTVEPGIYFVPALLRDPELRARHRDAVDWDRAERMLDFGGIRIEDNVLVTEGEPEVLTADVPV
jgi:Xaa-Pro aminopeptidase